MGKLFETAAGVSNQWSLAAFAIAAILYFVVKRRGKVPAIAWACIASIVIIGLVPILAAVYLEKARLADQSAAIYRVRVTVLDPRQVPVEDARIWSTMGGEAKKVAGGWQLDIPAASRPADGKLTVFATFGNAFLAGRRELQLNGDRNPTIIIQLEKDTSATVRGVILDGGGRSVAGARVSVTGYESEAISTPAGGNFVLPAHAANGQQVQLRAEKAGYGPVTQWHPAGDEPVTLLLKRR